MTGTLRRLARGVVAALALAALLGGLPALLVAGVGWPLPTSVPDWQSIQHTFTQQGITGRMVVDTLALVLWVIWALLGASFGAEAIAVVRRRQAPAVPLAGPLQGLVGALVAMIVVAVVSSGGGHRGASAKSPSPLAQLVARTVTANPAPVVLQTSDPAHRQPSYTVRHGDTAWGIAERKLGDGLRWRELFELNRSRLQPDGGRWTDPDVLFAGWVLIMPSTDTVPSAPTSSAQPPSAPAPVSGAVMDRPTRPTEVPPTAAPSPSPTGPPVGGRPAAPVAPPPAAPAVPTVRGPLIDLPSGGLVAVSFASGVGTALALMRLQRRRTYRPAEPRALRDGERLETPLPLVRQLRRLQLRDFLPPLDGQGADDEPQEVKLAPPSLAELPAGHVVVGEVDGCAAIADLPAIGGLGLAGASAADALRAVALDLVMRAGKDLEVIVADEAHVLALDAIERPGVHVVPTLSQALASLEVEVLRRSRLLAATETPDIDALAASEPDELLPFVVLVATTEPADQGRLDALLRAGRQLRIAGVVGGQCSSGVTIEVGEGGRVERVDGPVLRELAGGRAMMLSVADGLECIEPLRVGREEASEGRDAAQPIEPPVPSPPPRDGGDEVQLVGHPDSEATTEAPRPVRVALLGGYRIEAGDAELKRGLRSLARAILAYLLLHPRGATADVLIEVLCDYVDPSRAGEHFHAAMGNLRSVLRKATGLDTPWFIERVGDLYRPEPSMFDCDVWRFEAALTEYETACDEAAQLRALESAVAAYGGDLLHQSRYEWPEPLREAMRGRATDALVRMAERAETANPEHAASLLERAIRLNPDAEDLYRRLMRLHGRVGRADAVRRTWRQLLSALGQVDADPDDASEAAFTEALNAAAGREAAGLR